jgi:hypothetical protein
MLWWKLAGITLIAIGVVVLWTKEHIRKFRMRSLARRLGLNYIGKRLPEALSLYGTPFAHINSLITSNVLDGEHGEFRIVVFDCDVYEGSTSWSRTVIAARKTGTEAFTVAISNPNLKEDHSAGWSILYRPKAISKRLDGLTRIRELEADLTAIGN